MLRAPALVLGALLTAAPAALAFAAPDAAGSPDSTGTSGSDSLSLLRHRDRQRSGEPPIQAPLLFSADEVQYDDDLGLVVAKGHVEISQRDEILLADAVTYNQRTDTVTASGHVSLLQPSGDILFADFVELHDNMRDGFIRNIRVLLADRSRLAGNTARRVEGNRMEIRRGVYSACDLCKDDPTKPPAWQINAEQIIHDKELQIVEYRDAFLEIDGLPIFWTPYFSIPDPSSKRQSGFLSITPGNSTGNLGQFIRIPYYWVISEDKDLTISPEFTTEAGTYIGSQYRQRFGNGYFIANGSFTVGSQSSVTINGITTPPASGVRGHLFTDSEFDLNENWRAGVNIQRASDQTYLLRYNVQNPNTALSLTSLNSHVFGEYFGTSSYANISSWAFQSLRSGVGDRSQPYVAPLASYEWVGQPDSLGGQLSLEGSGLDLFRIKGIDTRRLSSGANWQMPFDGLIGDKLNLSLHVRGDGYNSENVPVGSGPSTQGAFAGRIFPQLALNWRYPWVRRAETYNQVIEPIVMLAAAPNGLNPSAIPNEDGQGFEFDENTLFRPNRLPGFDRVDSGQRVDYGIRGGIYGDNGGSTRVVVGQSRSLEINPAFSQGSGLDHRQSDVVGRVNVSPSESTDFFYRFRLDHGDLAMRRQEVGTSFGPNNLRLSVSYLDFAANPEVPGLVPIQQAAFGVSAQLTRYWSTYLTTTRSFAGSAAALSTIGTLTYRDECMAFILAFSRTSFNIGDVVPGTAVTATIVLKNLGQLGTKVGSFGG